MPGIVKKADTDNIVFTYEPKEFPMRLSEPATDFVSKQVFTSTDFQINELAAHQSGIRQQQRDVLIKKVEEEALLKLKEVEQKAYKEAYDLGLVEGTEKAFTEKKQELENRLQQVDEMLKTFENMKGLLIVQNEKFLVKLMYLIAKKIALKEITLDPEAIVSALTNLTEHAEMDETVTVKVSDNDLTFLTQLRQKVGKDLEFLKRVKLESDSAIQSGGCIVETNFGIIEATLEQRVVKIWDELERKIPKLKSADRGKIKTDGPAKEATTPDSGSEGKS